MVSLVAKSHESARCTDVDDRSWPVQLPTDPFVVHGFPDISRFKPVKGVSHRLRICIATEEIIGPVRNGGIASTYYYLARMLTDAGHDVTILYLKGHRSEDNTIEHWIDIYRSYGIRLVPLPFENVQTRGWMPLWQGRYYNFYRWLKSQETFDVVHTSEWRGGAFYALLAKKQGIAFRNTLFLVKASSPHIWNRYYMKRFLDSMPMLGVMYTEQKTLELGDLAIGGSAHLLCFMEHIGYSLPRGRTYVQPNVIRLDSSQIGDKRPRYNFGEKVKTSELVFFGRLEARKGLDVFCDALDFLVRRGAKCPSKVSFLGKESTASWTGDLKPSAYIRKRAEQWPFEVVVHVDFDQIQAINYLTTVPRIAVMPSLIENSTMAVYEALVYRIPFIASNAGGTPELVAPEYHDKVLTNPDPRNLAQSIERVLREGGTVAECAFDNEKNLKTWHDFHEYVAAAMSECSAEATLARLTTESERGSVAERFAHRQVPSLSVCIYHCGKPELLDEIVAVLWGQRTRRPDEIVVAVDEYECNMGSELDTLIEHVSAKGIQFVSAAELTVGEAYNKLAEAANCEAYVFLRSDIHRPSERFVALLTTALAFSAASVFSGFYDVRGDDGWYRYLTMGGDLASGVFDHKALCGSVIAVRAAAFHANSGFSTLRGVAGIEQDFAVRAARAGYELETIPEVLYEELPDRADLRLNEDCSRYIAIQTLIEESPYYIKRVLLATDCSMMSRNKSKNQQGNQRKIKEAPLHIGGCRFKVENELSRLRTRRRLVIAFDKEAAMFYLCVEAATVDAGAASVEIKSGGRRMGSVTLIDDGTVKVAQFRISDELLRRERTLLTFQIGGSNSTLTRTVWILRQDENEYALQSRLRIESVAAFRRIKWIWKCRGWLRRLRGR